MSYRGSVVLYTDDDVRMLFGTFAKHGDKPALPAPFCCWQRLESVPNENAAVVPFSPLTCPVYPTSNDNALSTVTAAVVAAAVGAAQPGVAAKGTARGFHPDAYTA